jgi:death-on-curing protein
MIGLKEVEAIHEILIERFGGTKGIRDAGALESAINRPYQTFDSIDLYPQPEDKAAAVFESLISNHPFIDGNKRTAYVMMRLTLRLSGKDITADEQDKYDFVIKSAEGKLTMDEIRNWIILRMR